MLEGLAIYAIVVTVLFFLTAKRMEKSNDSTLETITKKLDEIKPERIRVKVDSSPWNLSKRVPVEELEALGQMWEALNTRGIVGDNVDRLQHLFGAENFNRVPLDDGRIVVWYGNTVPSYIKKLISNMDMEDIEDIDDDEEEDEEELGYHAYTAY